MNGKDETYDKLMWSVAETLANAKYEFIIKPNGKNSEQIADCMISDVVDTIAWLHNNHVINGIGFMNYIKQFVYVHDGIYDGQIPNLKEN